MNKYDSLRGTPSDDIYGSRYVVAYSNFLRKRDKTIIIHGFPPCPECGHILARDFLGAYWHCTECGTVWHSIDLVQAIKTESAMIQLSIRNLED